MRKNKFSLILVVSGLIGLNLYIAYNYPYIKNYNSEKAFHYFQETENHISSSMLSKDYGQMETLSLAAVEKAENANDSLQEKIFLRYLANAYQFQNKFTEAEETHLKTIKLIETKKLESQFPDVYYDAALFFYRQRKCEQADDYAGKALSWQSFSDGTVNAKKTGTYNSTKSILDSFKNKYCPSLN